jgi:hypothetical protein
MVWQPCRIDVGKLTIWRPFYLSREQIEHGHAIGFDLYKIQPILIRSMIGHGVEKSMAIIEQRFPKCSKLCHEPVILMQDAKNFTGCITARLAVLW